AGPYALALDPVHDELLVSNITGQSITVHARAASGNTAPLRTLAGPATGLAGPRGLAVDTVHDEILAANIPANATTVPPRRPAAGGGVRPRAADAAARDLLLPDDRAGGEYADGDAEHAGRHRGGRKPELRLRPRSGGRARPDGGAARLHVRGRRARARHAGGQHAAARDLDRAGARRHRAVGDDREHGDRGGAGPDRPRRL